MIKRAFVFVPKKPNLLFPSFPRSSLSLSPLTCQPVSIDEVYALQELFETVSNSLVADGLIHKHEWAAALMGPAAAAAVAAEMEQEKQQRQK